MPLLRLLPALNRLRAKRALQTAQPPHVSRSLIRVGLAVAKAGAQRPAPRQ